MLVLNFILISALIPLSSSALHFPDPTLRLSVTVAHNIRKLHRSLMFDCIPQTLRVHQFVLAQSQESRGDMEKEHPQSLRTLAHQAGGTSHMQEAEAGLQTQNQPELHSK